MGGAADYAAVLLPVGQEKAHGLLRYVHIAGFACHAIGYGVRRCLDGCGATVHGREEILPPFAIGESAGGFLVARGPVIAEVFDRFYVSLPSR